MVYLDLNETPKANDSLHQALLLRRVGGDVDGEATTFHNLMFFHNRIKNPRFAVAYGKMSVNIFQQLRSKITGTDKKLQ